jgi:hypothetical protein
MHGTGFGTAVCVTTHPFRRFFGDVCFETTILYGKACCQVVCLRPGMAHDDGLNMCALFLHVILWGGATCPVYVHTTARR